MSSSHKLALRTHPQGVFAGCTQLPGHISAEASALAEASPVTVIGHEVAHYLNLEHDLLVDFLDLMYSVFPMGRI